MQVEKEESATKADKNEKKKRELKKMQDIVITRPDIIMYDVIKPIKEVKKKIEAELPELMATFPTEEKLDLGAYQKIVKLRTAKKIVKKTTIVKNLSQNRDIICTEPKSHLFHVKHDFLDIDYEDDKSEDKDKKRTTPPIIRYALSNRSFIDNGWTQLPVEKLVRKMFVYGSHPVQPEFDWFRSNRNKGIVYYDTGEKLAEVDDTGYGRWYYKNGLIAMDYHKSENATEKERVIVYSNGEPDETGKKYPVTPLAMFDKSGNGIVFDHNGKIRIKFNQSEGMVLDPSIGPTSHWKWHTLNDPPVILKSSFDTFSAEKDPNIWNLKVNVDDDKPKRIHDGDMLTVELQNCAKEMCKNQKQKFNPFHIKMKALKINKQFSLNILDQTKIHLKFREGLSSLKINLGIYLDPGKVVDTVITELGIIENSLFSQVNTDSKTLLQEHYKKSKKSNERRSLHESRIRNVLPVCSADRMLSGRARPMHHPLLYAYSGLCKCAGGRPYIERVWCMQ